MLLRMIRENPYGWLVVAVLFTVLTLVMSARSALGLLIPEWEKEFAWDRTFISTGGSVMLTVMAIGSPVAGMALDRYGARTIFVMAILVTAVAVCLTAGMWEDWHFIAAFGLIGGIGFSIVSAPLIGATVALYFDARRGLATGIATSGATGGQLVLMPLLAVGLGTIGWRASFLAVGLLLAATALLTWTLIRREAPESRMRGPQADAGNTVWTQLGYLMRDRTFWLLGIGYIVCGFTTIGAIRIHFLPYAAACGFPPIESATAFGVLATTSAMGIIGFGAAADKFHRPALLAAIYFLRALCFILLMFIPGDSALLFIFAALFGLFDFATFPVVANIVGTHMGLRIMGLTMGLLFSLHSVGGALGSFAGGWVFDLFAQYDWMWLASFALALLAAFLSILVHEPHRTGFIRVAVPA